MQKLIGLGRGWRSGKWRSAWKLNQHHLGTHLGGNRAYNSDGNMMQNYLPSYGDYLLSVLDFLAIILTAANVTKFRKNTWQGDSQDSYFVTPGAKFGDKIEIMIWPDYVFVM